MSKTSTATLAKPEYLNIQQLVPSSTNPRKFFDENSLNELTQSIKTKGIIAPLIVRPADMSAFSGHIEPADAQLYEIVAGERRYRAAQRLELKQIPVRVQELTDEEAFEVQQIENLQRADLDPLDEADGYGRLLDAGNPIQTIAMKLGKPIEYIARRLKLRTLTEYSRQAFNEKLITVDHALLLAKLGPTEQDEALRYTLCRYSNGKGDTEKILKEARESRTGEASYWEPTAATDLRQHIEYSLKLELKKAPWDLADADLVASAGACTTCPSNTAANTALFGDLAIEKATCTDSVCFNAKRQAFVQLQVEAVADAGKASVKISWKHTMAKPKFLKDGSGPDPSITFKRGQWVEAKKGECEHVITGVTIDFDDGYGGSGKPGTKKSVCIASGCKKHTKDYERASLSSGSSRSTYDTKAEEEKRKKQEAKAKEESRLRVGNTIAALKLVKKTTPELLRRAAIGLCNWSTKDLKDIIGSGVESKLQSIDTNSAEFAQILTTLLLQELLQVNHLENDHSSSRKKFCSALKDLTGYDAAPNFKKQEAKPTKKAKK